MQFLLGLGLLYLVGLGVWEGGKGLYENFQFSQIEPIHVDQVNVKDKELSFIAVKNAKFTGGYTYEYEFEGKNRLAGDYGVADNKKDITVIVAPVLNESEYQKWQNGEEVKTSMLIRLSPTITVDKLESYMDKYMSSGNVIDGEAKSITIDNLYQKEIDQVNQFEGITLADNILVIYEHKHGGELWFYLLIMAPGVLIVLSVVYGLIFGEPDDDKDEKEDNVTDEQEEIPQNNESPQPLSNKLIIEVDGEQFEFSKNSRITIGCSDECDIFIPDPALDELQGEVVYEDGAWIYYDKSDNHEVRHVNGSGPMQIVNDPSLSKRKQGWVVIGEASLFKFSDSILRAFC
ncbi:FHA domain-containing protein [Thalassotalea crassostreae]|uniref:FHA domain-containing protein n=1 Tax=Thalassotalea crassostreae TaxID=1763536 RepID=UPI000837CDF4|nr:FHA domain-containing protein [Thalassotalea crassostreae]